MAERADVVFVDGVRTPFGRAGDKGMYWNTRADDLAVKAITGLLERNPKLQNSIRLRLPYIEPLNHLEIELLRRFRSGETDQKVRDGIHLTINAIATALRNSG